MAFTYFDLLVWQRAMDLAERVYESSSLLPRDERFGLTSQMRRAAVSVASNIAEGHGRRSTGEFRQFLGYAVGSLHELETQLRLSVRLTFLTETQALEPLALSAEVGKLLAGLLRSLRRNRGPNP